MKKMEASMIKKKSFEDHFTTFVNFSFELSTLSSLSYYCTLRVFLEHSWSIVAYLGIGVRKERKSRKAQGDNGINNYNMFSLQVPSCIYDFLASFGIHGICMWLFGYDFSLTWRIVWIDSGFA